MAMTRLQSPNMGNVMMMVMMMVVVLVFDGEMVNFYGCGAGF